MAFNFNWFIISGNYIFKLSWLPQLCAVLHRGNQGYRSRVSLSANQTPVYKISLCEFGWSFPFRCYNWWWRECIGAYLQLLQWQNYWAEATDCWNVVTDTIQHSYNFNVQAVQFLLMDSPFPQLVKLWSHLEKPWNWTTGVEANRELVMFWLVILMLMGFFSTVSFFCCWWCYFSCCC